MCVYADEFQKDESEGFKLKSDIMASMNGFKIYVCVSLALIVILLAALVGSIVYAGKKASTASNTVNTKVDSFNQSVQGINKNLQNINSQLQEENSKLSSRGVSIP